MLLKTPTHELFHLLESRYALRMLWALRDGRPQTFRLLQDSVGSVTPNTLNTRIKQFRHAGLLDHGKQGYFLTALGIEATQSLAALAAFSEVWPHKRVSTLRSKTEA